MANNQMKFLPHKNIFKYTVTIFIGSSRQINVVRNVVYDIENYKMIGKDLRGPKYRPRDENSSHRIQNIFQYTINIFHEVKVVL